MQHSIAAKYAARPAARFVRTSSRARERRLGLRTTADLPGRAGPGDRAAPSRSRPAAPAAGQLAVDPGRPPQAGAERPDPSRGVDALVASERPGAREPLERRIGAVARLKQATATSAGGVVVRYEAGIPQFVAGRRKPDQHLDPAQGHAEPGRDRPSRRRSARSPRRPGSRSGSSSRSTRSRYTFAQRGARIHKTVFYFLMRPTGGDLARHDHEFDEVRWFDLADAGGVLTFESERGLVDRAAERVAGREPATWAAGPVAIGRDRVPERWPAPTDDSVRTTPLLDRHRALGARLIDFAGWLDAGPVRGDPRGAPGGPRAGRPVRPVAHGRAVRRGAGGRARRWPTPWSATRRPSPSDAPTTR